MNNAIFISEEYLKQNTIINGNVDTKYLLVNMRMVEDVQIHPILGTNLYEKMKSLVVGNNVSGDYKILLEDYIQPAMMYWLQTEMPVDMVYKWENKSIVKKNSENSATLDIAELQYLINKKEKIAMFYTERLTKYLVANPTSFPEYFNYGSTVDSMPPIQQISNYGGIYLGNGKNSNRFDSIGRECNDCR